MSLRRLPAIAALTLVALAGCEGPGSEPTGRTDAETATPTQTAAPGPERKWTRGYPNSIAVLGHSGATGENSAPDQPGVEVRENSWATGTNPEVNSVYLRILERNPAIEGQNVNYAEAGATIDQVAAKADRLLGDDPDTDLILIQVMDNDLTCPLDTTALDDFRARVIAMLQNLDRSAPNSSLFVVSQFGSVPTYARSLTRDERASQGGTGPCDFMTPTGDIARKKVRRLERAIHAYEGTLKAACEQAQRCSYDSGAFAGIVDRREYLSDDFNHLSIEGHAKAAAVTWNAMHRAGVLPRTR